VIAVRFDRPSYGGPARTRWRPETATSPRSGTSRVRSGSDTTRANLPAIPVVAQRLCHSPSCSRNRVAASSPPRRGPRPDPDIVKKRAPCRITGKLTGRPAAASCARTPRLSRSGSYSAVSTVADGRPVWSVRAVVTRAVQPSSGFSSGPSTVRRCPVEQQRIGVLAQRRGVGQVVGVRVDQQLVRQFGAATVAASRVTAAARLPPALSPPSDPSGSRQIHRCSAIHCVAAVAIVHGGRELVLRGQAVAT